MKRQKVDCNIYRFFGKTIVGRVATITKSEQNDTLLWHKWLGYIGERKDRPRWGPGAPLGPNFFLIVIISFLYLMSRPKPDTRICDHDRHANIKPKPDINKNQLNF